MTSRQPTTSCALIILLLFLLNVAPAFAAVFRWPDAFHYIDFGATAFSPFELYSPSDFSEPPNVWTSFHPELGAYGGHVWKPEKLEYNLDVTGFGFEFVDVKLGFAEVYLPTCTSDARIMRISVNNKTIAPVDIFTLVGCRRPHDIVFEKVLASSPIKVLIEGIVENPMIANIVVRETTATLSKNITSLPGSLDRAPISRSFGAFNKVLFITASNKNPVNGIRRTSVFKDKNALIEGTIRPELLSGHRHGRNFTYHIEGKGKYEIQLAFAEINPIYCEGTVQRIFSVYMNGRLELSDLDVFEKHGCRRAFIHTSSITFTGNLFIRFTGRSGNAMVSHIIARKLKTSCTPESTADAATSDHLAHSVPGQYPPLRAANSQRAYIDHDNNGFELVSIDGKGSHTHFFDTDNNIAGRITSYEWTSPDTTEFISDKEAFDMKFRLGTTRLFLRVEDNICTSHEAETSVTVTSSVTKGNYCYFYPGQTTLPDGGGPDQEVKPTFARMYQTPSWNFTDLPFGLSDFAARCQFFVSIDSTAPEIRGFIRAQGRANVSLLRGADILVDNQKSSSFSAPLVAAMSSFEVLYLHSASKQPPLLTFSIRPGLNPTYSFDRSTIFPVIASLLPRSSSLAGTTVASVEVLGAPLTANEAKIGNKTVPILRRNVNTMKLFFEIPPSEKEGRVQISIKWVDGFISNSLEFTYFDGPAEDPIGFTEHVLISNGEPVRSELASSVRIAYDGNIYLGTLNAQVVRLTYNPKSLRVTRKCQSEPLRNKRLKFNGTVAPRAILGMAFNPKDRIPLPYVSTQTLFWRVRKRINRRNPKAWRNGAIDRLKPGTSEDDDSICLVFNKRIISGLPVSNHDHGVNGIEFTTSGDLIIAIGGNTNAGLPGKRLGQLFETPLSGSIILAKLSKGAAFDGKIRYSNDTHPHRARVVSGDIEFIATGLRNPFFPCLHSSGRLYTADNGPNAGFGNVVSTCSEIDANITYPSDELVDFPGQVKLGPNWSMYSVARPDKLLNIKLNGKPRFYGHPNPSRGECTFVDPFTNKGPNKEQPPSNYQPPLLTMRSSTNAVVEYHAGNVFNGALKGKLILSTYQNRPTYYIPPITEPGNASLETISPVGGLSLAVDAWGQIIVPRLQQNNILVLRPSVPNLEVREAVSITAVTPFRHPRRGRTVATIGGYNFGPGVASVEIGQRPCPVLTQSLTRITCRTPKAAEPGVLEKVVVTITGRGKAILRKGVWYMEV